MNSICVISLTRARETSQAENQYGTIWLTTVFVDWERPEADELRPDAEAMEEVSVLLETER